MSTSRLYTVTVVRDGVWKHVATYFDKKLAVAAISAICKSKAKKWNGVGEVVLFTRPWAKVKFVAKWKREVKA